MAPRFLSSLLHSLHKKKSRPVPAVFPPKPIMSTKIAQLGGTASDVTVGKIGVSVSPLTPILILTFPPTFVAWFDDDDVRSSLLRCVLSQYRCFSPSWRNPQTPDEEAFAALKAGMDDLPPGTKMFLNSGAYTEESCYPLPLFTLTPRF
jgi:hypothetical protein